MFSIITCSINENYLSKFKESVAKTVKSEYEIIVIENNIDQLSLTQAYNKGAFKAKFENLVFVHEDVEFLNTGWDINIIELLNDSSVGVVGVAGSTYLPSSPSGWYLPDNRLNKIFINQGYKYKSKETIVFNQGEDLTPVYLLDGVFLAMNKKVFKEFLFNEKLEGFHAYDVDLCQRVSANYQNFFTNRVEILHYSEGNNEKTYVEALIQYKLQFINKFAYNKRNYFVEFELLKALYNGNFHNVSLKWYFNKCTRIEMIKPFLKLRYLGLLGYIRFIKLILND